MSPFLLALFSVSCFGSLMLFYVSVLLFIADRPDDSHAFKPGSDSLESATDSDVREAVREVENV